MKLVIELVGLKDNDPVGDSRSEPVDMLRGGLKGSEWLRLAALFPALGCNG